VIFYILNLRRKQNEHNLTNTLYCRTLYSIYQSRSLWELVWPIEDDQVQGMLSDSA